VLGLGHIGKEIGRLARVLGLKVIGIRRSPREPDDPVDELYTPENLHKVLPRADWLVVACPLTPETKGLVDCGVLAALPVGARLINIARGEIVDESALIQALTSQRLAGAYLDVFQKEPLPAESPLWDLPNVYVTPHNASAAAGNDDRVYSIFLENLSRWRRTQPLLNEVKPKTTS
jgi:phosphoglycerate dehydrogenase-like enzyme